MSGSMQKNHGPQSQKWPELLSPGGTHTSLGLTELLYRYLSFYTVVSEGCTGYGLVELGGGAAPPKHNLNFLAPTLEPVSSRMAGSNIKISHVMYCVYVYTNIHIHDIYIYIYIHIAPLARQRSIAGFRVLRRASAGKFHEARMRTH